MDSDCSTGALIPAALRAIATLSSAGILPSNYSNASSYATTWETNAYKYFEVPISSARANASLANYVQKANLSSSLLYGAGSLNSTISNSTSQASTGSGNRGWSALGQTIGSELNGGNSTMFGLSINRNGSVVEVSDPLRTSLSPRLTSSRSRTLISALCCRTATTSPLPLCKPLSKPFSRTREVSAPGPELTDFGP